MTPYLDTVLIDGMRVPETNDGVVELVVFHPPRRMKETKLVVTEEEAA